jgi:hypothetical protein
MKNRQLYAIDWFDTIRPSILLRDSYTCQHCKVKHRSWIIRNLNGTFKEIPFDIVNFEIKKGNKIQRIFLNVCHIDQNPANNNNINLLSLCTFCHFKMDHHYNIIKKIAKKNNLTINQLNERMDKIKTD